MDRTPRIPRLLERTLDFIQPDALVGDIYEEYQDIVRPNTGPLRARIWFWKHVLLTIVFGLLKVASSRKASHLDRSPQTHPTRGTPRSELMGTLLTDVRYGVRMLFKTPGLSLTAIITIALGVGLTTHTFSVVYGSVIRGLPIEDGERLMHVNQNNLGDGINNMGLHIHDFLDWREQQTVFHDLAAFYQGTVNIADGESRPERFQGAFVTASVFTQLGVQPILGRLFQNDEDFGRASPTIILGYDVWRNRYGGDPDIVGRTVRANGLATTVAGVMPEGFRFPFMEDVWVPLAIDPATLARDEGFRLSVIGRLQDGITRDEAAVQLSAIALRLAAEYPETNDGVGVGMRPYVEWQMPPQITAVLWVMLVAVFGVLLIACANVANLLLARAAVRSKEVAIRSALGASRSRVIRQLLVESTVIAVIGGGVGVLLSYVGINAFNAWLADIQKPYWIDIALHPAVLVFGLGITLVASLVAGAVPALKASGADVHEILKDETKGSSSFRMSRFSTALVVGEIAVSCGLLIGAGFLIKSVVNLNTVDLGFEIENVFTSRVGLFETDYPDRESRQQFFDQLLPRLRAIPGAQAAALTTQLPASGAGSAWFGIEGETYDREQDYPVVHRAAITPGYYETFGVRIVEGRAFTLQDRMEGLPTTIVNQSFARRYFPEQSALGKRIRLGRSDSQNPWLTIVGVVPDIYVGGGVGGIGSDQVSPEHIYTPVGQGDNRFLSIAIKTAGPPLLITADVRDIVVGLDPNLPIYNAQSMDEVIKANTWAFGMFGSLFGIFGVVALFMAAVGLYGVMAFAVSRRTQELGIRMALGAHGKDIIRLILRNATLQLGIGMTAGIALGAAMGRPLQIMLYDVSPDDLSVYGATILTLGLAGLLACVVPARRATRVDLVDALKPE